MKLAVVVTIFQGKENDTDLLKRFLLSFFASDAPKESPIVIVACPSEPGKFDTLKRRRQEGIVLAMNSGADIIIMTEQDFTLPKVWWSEFEKLFLSDPMIGIVGAKEQGNIVPPEQYTRGDWTLHDGHWRNGIEGFVAFRRTFLEAGLGEMGGDAGSRFKDFPFCWTLTSQGWKYEHIPQVVFGHNKYVKEEKCPNCGELLRAGPKSWVIAPFYEA